VSESRELEKLVFCLTGPYLTRRATIGWLELPFELRLACNGWQGAVRWPSYERPSEN